MAMSAKPTFRQRQFAVREDAILDAANILMAQKGFDLMSMDDIAAEVGVAKGSLYKHFESKEALAAATMTRLLRRTIAHARALAGTGGPLDRLRTLLGWCLRERLAGGVPHLPSTSKALQVSLLSDEAYVSAVTELNDLLAGWVAEAKRTKEIRSDLPDEVVLYTIYARTCDPTLEFLVMTGKWSDTEIVDYMVAGCFEGIAPQPKTGRPATARKVGRDVPAARARRRA